MSSEYVYDVAQICRNGHLINAYSNKYPDSNKKFCELCGSKTICECESCAQPIRGKHFIGDMPSVGKYTMPLYCHNCGTPFPWIKDKLDAANELLDLIDDVSDEDRALLHANIEELITESARTQVAALKVKKVLAKSGASVINALRVILVDIMSETAKKTLWPNGNGYGYCKVVFYNKLTAFTSYPTANTPTRL